MERRPADTTYPLEPGARCATACRRCASHLLQLEAWAERPAGGLTLRMRCPECQARTIRDLDAAEAARADDALSAARLEMVAFYEAIVRSNIEREAALLAKALALDLVGPDDFVPRQA